MNIGARLKEERERLNFDQEQFAALGAASRHSQIDWEKGKSFPNAKFLAAIAAAGADVQYILTGQRLGSAVQTSDKYQSVSQQTQEIAEQALGYAVLRPDQRALLDNLEHCSKEDQAAIKRMALLAAKAVDTNETQPEKKFQVKKAS